VPASTESGSPHVAWQPAVHRRQGLPASVSVYEVGPRDGLQIEKEVLSTATKVAFVEGLVAAGLPAVEVTSFVPPSWIPQLADGADVLGSLDMDQAMRFPVLVPNVIGLHRAVRAGAREVAVVVSATESFSLRNLNRSRDEALGMAADVIREASTLQIPVRGYVSMVFGDPWEGPTNPAAAAAAALQLMDAGCTGISLGDTIGVATPGHVQAVLARTEDSGIPVERTALHLHDTYGQALANVLAGLEAGVCEFDSSAGGLGGCPYARSATGNLATEDLVWMLHGLGIETGVDLRSLVEVSVWMATKLGRPSPSRVVTALTPYLTRP
jgi:hydroxymethylglutaryl-CoA lyase